MLAAPGTAYPLPFAPSGATVVIVEIRAGRKLRQHLYNLGFVPGRAVRVVKCAVNGALIVAVANDSRVALGHGAAHKLIVRTAALEEVA